MARAWHLLLNRGGMRSLVATAMQSDYERLAMLYVHEGRVSDEPCLAAAAAQCEHYDAGKLLELSLPHLVEEPDAAAGRGAVGEREPLGEVQLVLAACSVAIRLNADRLIWPVQVGEGFESVAKATETLLLVSQIVAVECGTELAIETPLLEVTDRQLVEIGHQMSVPWEKARTCHAGRGEPCGACAGCQRRNEAFAAAGIEDPLHLGQHQA